MIKLALVLLLNLNLACTYAAQAQELGDIQTAETLNQTDEQGATGTEEGSSNTVNIGSLGQDKNSNSGVKFDSSITSNNLSQVFVALIFVVFVIFLLSFVLRKMNIVKVQATGIIQILSSVSLNNKDRLLLVKVGNEQVLISACPGTVKKIHTLKSPVEIDDVATNSLEESSFAGLLKKLSNRQAS